MEIYPPLTKGEFVLKKKEQIKQAQSPKMQVVCKETYFRQFWLSFFYFFLCEDTFFFIYVFNKNSSMKIEVIQRKLSFTR